MSTHFTIVVLCLLVQCIVFFGFISAHEKVKDPGDLIFTYSQTAEIEKHYGPYLSSSSELEFGDRIEDRLKNELSFRNGDWEQENEGAPLMPFYDIDMPRGRLSLISPLKLVSFKVEDVNPVQHVKNAVNVGGVLTIGIYRDAPPGLDQNLELGFTSRSGFSSLSIAFEGVYTESMENGGQRVICLLGNSTLPSTDADVDNADFAHSYLAMYPREDKVKHDGKFLLVLRYPQVFNLTSRAIKGEMWSLTEDGFGFFDTVHIISQLSQFSSYQYAREIHPKACDPYPFRDELLEDGTIMYDAMEFCKIFQRMNSTPYSVEPNYNFHGIYMSRRKIGPFDISKEIKDVNWGGDQDNMIRLLWQHIRCENETAEDGKGNAKVSAVLRATPLTIDQNTATSRTGVSGMTLSAEGIWNSSSGQLCMIGCLGEVDSGLDGCGYQIMMYFPRSFSVKQRSIIMGSISSTGDEGESFHPLLFTSVLRPFDLYWHHWYRFPCKYNYSKINQARAFWNSSQPHRLVAFIKQSFLLYPALSGGSDLLFMLSNLVSDLYVDGHALPYKSSYGPGYRTGISVKMEVLSLGPLCGYYSPWLYNFTLEEIAAKKLEYIDSRLFSAALDLTFIETPLHSNDGNTRGVTHMFLEGIYDALLGEMYLVGCGKVGMESFGTERSLDCLIKVKVQYSPINMQWLQNPAVWISITSQRHEHDPVYFQPIHFRTRLKMLSNHEEDVAFRIAFEHILRILLLIMEIALILSQLFYMDRNKDVIPHISLVMLAIQFLGYWLPLLSVAETRISSKESESYRKHPLDLQRHQLLIGILNYSSKFLLVIALLLILRIGKKVRESRKGLHLHELNTSKHVPNDKRVLLMTSVIYVTGFTFMFVLPGILTHPHADITFWLTKLVEYFYLVYSFFMLPQIIANFLWKNYVQPLQRLYYLGFILLSVLPVYYDSIRDPILDSFEDEAETTMPDIVSAIGETSFQLVVMIAAIVITVMRHRQNIRKLFCFFSRKRTLHSQPSVEAESKNASDPTLG